MAEQGTDEQWPLSISLKKIAFGDDFLSPVIGDFRSPSRFALALAIGGQTTARWLVRGKAGGDRKVLYTFLCSKKKLEN